MYTYLKPLLFLALFSFGFTNQKPDFRIVTHVVDGDTIYVTNPKGGIEKIRLIGIDAHETRNNGKKKVGFYGKQATQYLNKLVLGKRVRLDYDVRKYDQYKRTLAYVYLENGTFVNADLVKKGYAIVYTLAPNVKFSNKFIQLQQESRKYKRGLWGVNPS